jgi:hypothetical protein
MKRNLILVAVCILALAAPALTPGGSLQGSGIPFLGLP